MYQGNFYSRSRPDIAARAAGVAMAKAVSDAEAHGRGASGFRNSPEEAAAREQARKLSRRTEIFATYDKIVKELNEILSQAPGPIETMDPKKKRTLFIAYKYYLSWPEVSEGRLVEFELEYDAIPANSLNAAINYLRPHVEEKQRRIAAAAAEEQRQRAAREESIRLMMLMTAKAEAAVFNRKLSAAEAAKADALRHVEALVKSQAEAALKGHEWKTKNIGSMDPEDKRDLAVGMQHALHPDLPVVGIYKEYDDNDRPADEVNEGLESLRKVLLRQYAPPSTTAMLGGRRTRRRRSMHRKKRNIK